VSAREEIRAEAFREAAAAIVAENDRMLWATKPGKHWAADLASRMAATADAVAQQGALLVPAGSVPQPLSAERLAEIEARADAATDGPWCTDSWEIYQGSEYEPGLSFWIGETCRGTADLEQDRADAAFVAAARSDVPALVAEIRRLWDERRSTNEALDDAVRELRARREDVEPDAITQRIAPPQVLGPLAGWVAETFSPKPAERDEDPNGLHHTYRVGRDLPELGGQR
jgi:hypothetical protein